MKQHGVNNRRKTLDTLDQNYSNEPVKPTSIYYHYASTQGHGANPHFRVQPMMKFWFFWAPTHRPWRVDAWVSADPLEGDGPTGHPLLGRFPLFSAEATKKYFYPQSLPRPPPPLRGAKDPPIMVCLILQTPMGTDRFFFVFLGLPMGGVDQKCWKPSPPSSKKVTNAKWQSNLPPPHRGG